MQVRNNCESSPHPAGSHGVCDGRATGGAQQRPDDRDDAELAELDAHVEAEQRRHEPVGGERHFGQDAGEAEAVDETEREREGEERFLDTYRRIGMGPFKEALYG